MEGFSYITDFISDEEQFLLIEKIDSLPWIMDLKRRTQHYGYKYDYSKKKINSESYVGPIPEFMEPLLIKLVKEKLFQDKPDQVIVNEYEPGQGIYRHVDCVTCFADTIASLSLNSTCVMNFEKLNSDKKGSVLLGPKSLLVLKDEARYEWMHSIPAKKEDEWKDEVLPRNRRVSLTFRNVILND